jgi:hypothetical protein
MDPILDQNTFTGVERLGKIHLAPVRPCDPLVCKSSATRTPQLERVIPVIRKLSRTVAIWHNRSGEYVTLHRPSHTIQNDV